VFDEFTEGLPDVEERMALRKRLSTFPFVHMLAGQQHNSFLRWLLALVVKITVVALPLMLLLWAQSAFLRYHDLDITCWQRVVVVLDAGILAPFWGKIVSPQGAIGWWKQRLLRAWAWFLWLLAWPWAVVRRVLRRPWQPPPGFRTFWHEGRKEAGRRGAGFLMVATLGAVFISLFIATVPDEPWEQYFLTHLLPKCWVVEDEDGNKLSERRFFWPTYVLFETEDAFFHRNLELGEKVLTVNELPAKVINALRAGEMAEREHALQEVLGIDLQGRNLRDAKLTESILPKANLRKAQLQGTNLRGAQLQGAELWEAQLQNASLVRAQLQGANLLGAQLQGAYLLGAELQGADLRGAQLQGADLQRAQLQGADLRRAQLQGADLQEAGIGGADFEGTNLDLADLRALDRKPLNKEQYQALSKQLEGAIRLFFFSDAHRLAVILERFKAAAETGDTLDKAKSAAQCLSDETPFASCFTKDQLATYRKVLATYLVELACSDSNIARSVAPRAHTLPDENDADEFIALNVDLATALLKADCEAVKKLPEDIQKSFRRVVELKKSFPPPQER
jgi:hypothetical protein